jgi:ABC-type transport system involved in cytochrome c biogenesis permease component
MFGHHEYSLPFSAAAPTTVWLVYLAAVLVYCSPMIIAFLRNVEYKWPLYFASLLLGWTGIGWAYCLYYAIFADKAAAAKKVSIAT